MTATIPDRDEIIRRGADVRVLARDAGRARSILGPRPPIRQVDIGDHDQVIAACAGSESVLLLTSHAHDMTDLQLRIIRALRRTGIKIVKISGTSSAVHPDGPYTLRQHWEVETILQASGQPYVNLRPNAYMQTLIGQIMLPAVRAAGTVPNAIANSGISFIDARDVGEVAAAVLTAAGWDGQTLVLTGPRPVTYAEIAATMGQLSGQPAEIKEITPADVGAMMAARGTPPWEAEHFQEMYEMFRRGESEFVSGDVERITGHPPRTVEAYLAETLGQRVPEGQQS